MAALNKLSSAKVRTAPPGKYSDGGGLWLVKRADGGAQWVLRLTVHGRRREMGIGNLQAVSLKEARAAAEKWRAVVREGKDPIKERDRLKRLAARDEHTLSSVALEAFEARKSQLKGDGKAGRWFSPLELHVLPKIGKVPVEEIDQQDIKNALEPIWHEKADTARKAMNRLNITLEHAAAMGLNVELQAIMKAKALLGKSRHKAKNIPYMPWPEVPAFYESLREQTPTQLALRLLILTAVRSYSVRFCHLDQIEGNIWTVPEGNMKGQVGAVTDFRVPLSDEALAVIELAKPLAREGYLFPSVRKGVISDATMSRHMERRELLARPHGFRSSFKTWCVETTDMPEVVVETSLAHVVGNKVERSYRRTDLLERRRPLMARWADHVTGKNASEVIKIA
ncbi:integrase arm-type DNA-binding domain-containing protein [Sulfitobacter sp. KE34]|uniref:tyrosine-type recombinase/integrase n=1 Tax=unclassified Sulfitobacter TaxID=196795 RepID=UPI0023E34594|nr:MULTISPECIES: integrase arm-type DNA-binding domain-containing protein [unclassified Sulfitobacter]MDF3350021.1 integrase arm-type DNA-binding domain-containing protein [Sulfitobacter sp. KE12]MDF3353693.1 integrase arm-type DNA-binding domain-containing protein [Sulfitobacter sp. KE27]MDF3357341.1 integrase arm-type DNA-binding domain-containing protein [Sulfitobacter sp. KE33]MDF3364765.1 integrase arm-type DNA-binding domain-containing protein [Sulfitobacter sp. Ks34]MDF3368373.1 integra